jgi:PAS domain S-box-containing protein
MSESKLIHILLVEDEPGDAELLRITLRSSRTCRFDVTHVMTLAEARLQLGKGRFDVIMLDLSLPDSTGLETVKAGREMAGKSPIIVLTGQSDFEFALSVLDAGASDYLLKEDIRIGELVRVIRYAIHRKEMEQRNQLLAMAVNAASKAIIITDADSRIEWVNPAFTELTGYELNDVLGMIPGALWRSGLQEKSFYERMWNCIRDGGNWRGELINKRKDGSLYHEEMSITPVPGEDGKVQHYIGIKEDISVRKMAERAVIAAKEAAEQSAQAKASFLANMSHEIRTPMNAILGLSELGMEENALEKTRHYLSQINQAANNLLGIINDVLDFSKFEAGKIVMENSSFSVHQLIADLEQIMQLKAEAKNLELRFTISEGVPKRLVGDTLRLRQVLTNLVGNAIKFTDQGLVEVIFDQRGISNNRVNFHIVVRDTGKGMSINELSRLFQPFVQGDPSTTRKYGGTGLGLAISQQLVNNMGGVIRCNSEQGKGSTFEFMISLGVDQSVPMVSRETRPRDTPRSGKALLVEDNAVNQMLAKALLGKLGMSVVLAEDGRKAVDALRQTPEAFDIVLMDIQMPEMNGYEATQIIRQELGLKKLPIVALTAHATREERDRCLAAGMDDHLPKPFSKQSLADTLGKWLGYGPE